ncbi:MAG: Mur ligase [Planctomycetota bacterium]|nr:MAG: Mur ligase [Planctomycetota bacterium]
MNQRDSRRLRGANFLWDRPSAILEVGLEPHEDGERLVRAWRAELARVLPLVGWEHEASTARVFPGGAMLALAAPMDALLAATEVNEWAFASALDVLRGAPARDPNEVAPALRAKIDAERNPRLPALRAAAIEHRVPFYWDDKLASVGHGRWSHSYALDALPDAAEVPWSELRAIPTAIVTGTNGKTTTVRLLGAIGAAWGKHTGLSSTDWVRVDDEILDRGDYSGPVGARLLLRDARTELAILETARGGIMRRGMALESVDVAAITNVANDHLGEFGNATLELLADAKFVVTRIAERVVLNADCELLHAPARAVKAPITWFARSESNPLVAAHLAAGGTACVVRDGALTLLEPDAARRSTRAHALGRVGRISITMHGTARHNVENCLAAAAIAFHLGAPPEAIARGLESFESTPDSNPGRLNVFELGTTGGASATSGAGSTGVRCIVDFAHNAHGFEALFEMARALAPKRWAVLVGQAGDRDDASIVELARMTWAARPDLTVLKEMKKYLRGRAEGEVLGMIEGEMRRAGAPDSALVRAPSEIEAVRTALAWSKPGDLLLLLCHAERERTIELLQRMRADGWKAGQPVPEAAAAEPAH